MATISATVPDLWPELEYEILAPRTILERQAAYLRARGKDYLDAEVTTVTVEPDTFIHHLDVIALQLGGMRARLLAATHRGEYYPVLLEAECFRPKKRTTVGELLGNISSLSPLATALSLPLSSAWPPEGDWRPVAWDQTAFIEKVGQVLKSGEARAVMDSIIARTNEKRLLTDPSAV